MPNARITSAGGEIDLYFEETGRGFPLTGVESGRWGTWSR